MGLKVAKRSAKTCEVRLKDNFAVTVRHVTQSEKTRLLDGIGLAGDDETEERTRQQSRKLADLYIDGWTGLTPGVIRALGVDLEEDPATDKDGFVPYDRETAGDLWFEALPARFSTRILQASNSLLEELEREKQRLKNA